MGMFGQDAEEEESDTATSPSWIMCFILTPDSLPVKKKKKAKPLKEHTAPKENKANTNFWTVIVSI
jgi:hypothetical protein